MDLSKFIYELYERRKKNYEKKWKKVSANYSSYRKNFIAATNELECSLSNVI